MIKLLILSLLLVSMKARSQNYPIMKHYDGETFHNPGGDHLHGMFAILKWKLNADTVKWPVNVENKKYPLPTLAPDGKGVVTFINHATFLLQLPGMNILTDPVFSERVSPFTFAGPKRVRLPGIDLENLPKIDVVIISHNHYDHMDLASLKKIDGKYHPLFLVPLGNEAFLKGEGLQNVHEMNWWDEYEVRKGGYIAFTPAEHWSARGLFDKNKSLWGGFVIKSDQTKIFFAGDTGYGEHFKEIKTRIGTPDLSLLPIGAYEPRWFMKYHHMNPEDAVMAHNDLGTLQSIGMHFGTFQLTDEGINDPVKKLESAREKAQIPADKFKVLDLGDSYLLP